MFPSSSNLCRPPFSPKYHQQESSFFGELPLNIPRTLLSHQQIFTPPYNFHGAVCPAVTPVVALQPMAYGCVSPVSRSDAVASFQGRKRQSQQGVPENVKRQRIHSHDSETAVVNPAVPLPASISVQSPVLHGNGSPVLVGCVPPLQDNLFLDPADSMLPVANDKLSQQILALFQACRQQASDLDRKERCRTELQREIQLIFPQSRLFLVGSSLNGFGTRISDGDLCLVVKEEPMNQKTEARRILSLVQKLFSTKLSRYIEQPQLIRAKVPIVKFRDKKLNTMMLDFLFFLPNSNVDFDLNVNNVIGIRNTFLLRAYAYIENRVRPLVIVVKNWAKFHDINDASRGTLSSYSLALMVLHYLQTLPEPILPSLQKNYPECFDPTMQLCLVHQAPRTIPPYTSKNGSSLGDLLIGFFRYYATEFDWSRQIISVREAKALAKSDGVEWTSKFICIEEPFDGTNTARAVREKQKFDIIRAEFAQAWRTLRDKKDLNYILPSKPTKHRR
ncbi:GLD2 polymerase, partial [Paradoxornis webbianus]|nr:GLD2 polymerase [Sinosuthora webbiana]